MESCDPSKKLVEIEGYEPQPYDVLERDFQEVRVFTKATTKDIIGSRFWKYWLEIEVSNAFELNTKRFIVCYANHMARI